MNGQLGLLRELRDREDPPRTGSRSASEMEERQDQNGERPMKTRDRGNDSGKHKPQPVRSQSKAHEAKQTTSGQERSREQERQTEHKRYHEYHSAQGRRTGDQYDGRRRSSRYNPIEYTRRDGRRKWKNPFRSFWQGLAQ